MDDWITTLTNLPNLHPALVHFPIALLPVAVLFDLGSYRRGLDWLGRAATILYAAAALGAGAAYWAGKQAADSLPLLAPDVQRYVNEHSDSGLYTLWVMGILAAARIGLDLWDRQRARTALRLIVLAAAVAGVGLLWRTADLGGGLVYRHGVAVARAEESGAVEAVEGAEAVSEAEPAAVEAEVGPAASRLATGPDGALEWRPLAVDREALGSILRPAADSDLSAISWLEPEGDAAGLGIAVRGEALLVLPGSFGDVQVQAELVLDEFQGTVGVAHHVRAIGQAGIFSVEVPAKAFVLGSVDGELRELDRGTADLPAGPVRMTVSAIGRHLKGLVADETVAHGHEPALPDGACGLLVRGRGTIRVLSMKVTPASG